MRSCAVISPPSLPLLSASTLPGLILPHVLFWHPLLQLQRLLGNKFECPHAQCLANLTLGEHHWNIGKNAGQCPRIIHDVDHMVLLVSAVYECPYGHTTLGTDPRILTSIPEQEYIPFILFHCSGVMRNFARSVISLTTEGLSFYGIEHFIKVRRQETIASLQLQLNCILSYSSIAGNSNITSEDTISNIFKPYPSNDLICKCFLKSFAENKQYFFRAMASLSTKGHISIDHTFKVAGYLRPDGRWITQYNSLFIVLNDIAQVIAWQLTKTTSIDECRELLCALKDRLLAQGAQLDAIYTDNCCMLRGKMEGVFGSHVRIYLDLFHAAQRITRTIPKRHPLCTAFMRDIPMLFRDQTDKGCHRTLPTPSAAILMKNLNFILTKWTMAEVNGWHIINNKTLKELDSLKVHTPGRENRHFWS